MQSQSQYQHLGVSWCVLWTPLTTPMRPTPRASLTLKWSSQDINWNRLLPSLICSWGFHVAVRIKFRIQAARNTGPVFHDLDQPSHSMHLLTLPPGRLQASILGQIDLENFLSLSGNLCSGNTHPGLNSQRPEKYNLSLSWETLSTEMWLFPLSFFSCLLKVLC